MFAARRPSVATRSALHRAISAAIEPLETRRLLSAGDIDTTFGTGGFRIEGSSTALGALARQSDGKLVVVGSAPAAAGQDSEETRIQLTRYNTNGTIDTTFGTGGTVFTDAVPGSEAPQSILIQADGKIVIAEGDPSKGFGTDTLQIVRYTTTGALDSSFANGGILHTNRTANADHINQLSNGQLVLSGEMNPGTDNQNLFFARLNTNGTPDTTFSGDGYADIELGYYDSLVGANPTNDGRIGFVGFSATFGDTNPVRDQVFGLVRADGTLDPSFPLVRQDVATHGPVSFALQNGNYLLGTNEGIRRYATNGMPDTTFGTNGVASTDRTPEKILVRPDGKIVAVYHTINTYPDAQKFGVQGFTAGGAPDTSFSGDGKAQFGFSSHGDDIQGPIDALVQPDNKLVLAGNVGYSFSGIVIGRVLTSGTLDSTFSGDGWATPDFDGKRGEFRDVTVQSDGKIVAIGYSEIPNHEQLVVRRYNSNGTPDTSFSGDGLVVINDDFGSSVALQTDGKILVGGRNAVYRFTTGGSLDSTFGGGDGIASGAGGQIALASNGSIYATKAASVYRFTSAGALDTSFGSGGSRDLVASTPLDSLFVGDLKVQADGKPVIVGQGLGPVTNSENTDEGFAVVRLNTNGSVDTAFGESGLFLNSEDHDDFARTVLTQPDGRIIVAGSESDGDVDIVRLDPNGTFDQSFGDGGLLYHVNASSYSYLRDAKLQSDGKIVVLGFSDDFLGGQFYLQRFNVDGSLDPSFTGDGVEIYDTPFNDPQALAIDSSGRFIVAGASSDHLTLGRVIGGGSSDPIQLSSKGTLIVTGTSGNDTINVTTSGGNITATLNGVGKSFAAASVLQLMLNGQDGNDTITVSNAVPTQAQINGGAGNDTITGGSGNTTMNGAEGDDSLIGGTANDEEFGGDGNDTFVASLGDDHLNGGNGNDLADYSARTVNLTLQLGVYTGGGQAGENDGLFFIEQFKSGSGDDSIVGSASNELLMGGEGNDTLQGGFGDDALFGEDGNDRLEGGGDNDYLSGGANNDVLHGGDGNDTLEGGTGADVSYGEDGDDTFFAKDGTQESLDGGAGTDSALRDTGSVTDNVINIENFLSDQSSSLSGFTFDDTNLNGQYDTGEKKTSGKTVFLDSNENGALDSGEASTVTDAGGNFTFTNLTAGTYHVRRVFPSGWTYSTPLIDVPLAAGQSISNLSIGSKAGNTPPPPQTGTLTGFTFDDTNIDGQFESGEKKTSGKTVFLDSNNNGNLDSGEQSTVTDTNGNFTFDNLAAGTYHVRRVFPSGWTYSTAPIDVTLSAGQTLNNLAIGSKAGSAQPPSPTASINGFTFDDTDKDGQYDSTEKKTSGKTVFLDTNNNGKLDSGEKSTVTNTSGAFSFTGLSAGTYHVRRIFPSGWTYSTAPIDLVLSDGQSVSNVAIGSKATG
jgi:uncharacterized delta-60 repeat protein